MSQKYVYQKKGDGMFTIFSNKTILLMALLILLAGCSPAEDRSTVTLSDSGEEVTSPAKEPVASTPGNMPGNAGENVEMGPETSLDTTTWQTYTNDTYNVEVIYPKYFAIKSTTPEDLDPLPLATINFVDTRSDLVDIAPPAFSVRIYANPKQQALRAWLKANGYSNETKWIFETYDGKNFTGIKILSTQYMSPGEFVFVSHADWIFQLTPLGEEGNIMLGAFSFSK